MNEYGPTVGVKELREAVAVCILLILSSGNRRLMRGKKMYNEEYREEQASQYTYENVCIVPGGRAGMARIAAVIVRFHQMLTV